MLTEDDDVIRSYDIPERMQLATSTLSQDTQLSIPEVLTQSECVEAAAWVAPRLVSKERDFFMQDGRYHHLLHDLVEAVDATIHSVLFVALTHQMRHRSRVRTAWEDRLISSLRSEDACPRISLRRRGRATTTVACCTLVLLQGTGDRFDDEEWDGAIADMGPANRADLLAIDEVQMIVIIHVILVRSSGAEPFLETFHAEYMTAR